MLITTESGDGAETRRCTAGIFAAWCPENFRLRPPVTKQAAESEAKARWPRATDSREEIERIRNFFDDFCVEIGFIELGLKSYYATNPSGSSVELSSTASGGRRSCQRIQ